MLCLRKPSAAKLRDFLAAQSKLDFAYLSVGDTASQPPRQLQKHFAKDSMVATFRAVSR